MKDKLNELLDIAYENNKLLKANKYMDKLLYINTVEDIRLREMVQNLEDDTLKIYGHAYVDLGLPSGTLWAKMNVGANSETDYGLYFAWGETSGYTQSLDDTSIDQRLFSWDDYKYGTYVSSDITNYGMTKYNITDSKTVLDLEDDAAAVNMGGLWHMPTLAQFQELLDNTTNTWVTNYNSTNVNGRLFTSKTDNTKTLFIPSAGYYDRNLVRGNGSYGYILSSSLLLDYVGAAYHLFFSRREDYVYFFNRCYGQSVRGVVG